MGAEQMATQDGDSTGASDTQTGSTGTSDQEYQTMDQEYQTMDRPENNYGHSTFRPPSGNYGPQGGTLQLQRPQESIPGVPGYANPLHCQYPSLAGLRGHQLCRRTDLTILPLSHRDQDLVRVIPQDKILLTCHQPLRRPLL